MVDKQKILRVNCPGYGHQSFFSSGCAEPLYNYSVIIVNPISVLHLFDKDPELLKQVEVAQVEGLTSYPARSDKLLESLTPDLDERMSEMVKFLEQGGLLLYFLCRPFVVQGPGVGMDNYSWLDVLAPDKPIAANQRNMATVSHGKNIELNQEGQSSPFARYLRQPGLEWTTLIRAENLTENYDVLAIAGPNKCVAAQLTAGEKGGCVLFLPAPYNKQFDDTLVSCIEMWEARQGTPSAGPAARAPAAEDKPAARAAEAPAAPPPAPSAARDIPPPPMTGKAETPPPAGAKPHAPPPPPPAAAAAKDIPPPMTGKLETPPPAGAKPPAPHPPSPPPSAKEGAPATPPPKPSAGPTPAEPGAKEAARDATPAAREPAEVVPRAKDLMEKMEEISKNTFPDWCQKYSFADLDQLRDELKALAESIKQTQQKMTSVQTRINAMESLKNALLTADGDELHQASGRVFEQLGWKVKEAPGAKGEFYLMDGQSTVAIVRIVRTASKPKSADLAQLAESIIAYWGQHEEEPKGILLASTYANRPPAERTEEDYSDALAEFAEKKNLCLMTSLQLLSIYRDLEGGKATGEELKEQILSTSGRLPGFSLEQRVTARAV